MRDSRVCLTAGAAPTRSHMRSTRHIAPCWVLASSDLLQMRVECTLTKDTLWGDEVTEIRIVLKEMMEEQYEDEDG